MNQRRRYPILLLLVAAAGLQLGCIAEPLDEQGDDGETGAAQSALDGDNGVSLNGVSLNGVSLNGTSLNGVSLNGVSLNGVSLNGTSLNGVSLNGTSLNGVSLNGVSLNGVSLNGASLGGNLSNGETLPLRIDAIAAGTGDNSDVLRYAVSYQGQGGWAPLCGEINGAPVLAIPLSGRWDERRGVPGGGAHIDDPQAITFACENKAIGKCVLFGYKPWTSVNGVSLADHHQACTRMVRADYCGDGVSWTHDGNPINLYDGLSIQVDTEPSWQFEAEFTPDGAACLSEERVKGLKTLHGKNPRVCFDKSVQGKCGSVSHFNDGTLLMVRHPN